MYTGRGLWAFLAVFLTLQLCISQVDVDSAQQPTLNPSLIESPFVPGELVVGLEHGDLALPLAAMQMVGAIVSQNPPIHAYVVCLADGVSMESAGEFLRALPGV
ncbi:MAG: S8 family serine peptidase, partial [Fimbriimonadales bacterium]